MMLFKISLKNISKSIKDYTIYFFTLILGVAIFYVFNAIDDQTIMMNVSSSTYEIIKLMTSMLSGVSVFVSLVFAFLIIYANRFLIKRRNKELGIYLTLGMSKRKVSLILFIETLLIGMLSLLIGICVGFLLSQLMSILVANMFEADLTKFKFIFSSSACLKTLMYFGIMYFVVMLFNTISISKCKLIDLLHSNKKSERIKLKNSWLCVIVFIISVCTLGYAYYQVTCNIDYTLEYANRILIPIGIGSVSTFLIFWSLSGLLLKIFIGMKGIYYKELNSFTLRQFSSKINTTVFSMTVICLMLFITICILSSALSVKNSMSLNLKQLSPVDIEIIKNYDITGDNGDSKNNIKEVLEDLSFNVENNFKNIIEFDTFVSTNLTVKDTLGDYYNTAISKYPFLMYDNLETIIKISDYNKIARAFNLEEYSLNDNEYIVVSNYDEWSKIRNNSLKINTDITINGNTYKPKFTRCVDGFYVISASNVNFGFFIVPDNTVNLLKNESILVADYLGNNEDKKRIEKEVSDLENNDYFKKESLELESKMKITENSIGLGALVTFIGLYLGIIFLISCAAILALKELSESSDNVEKFNMLRKIGASEKMINKALFRQIGIFFMFPLLIAIIHAIFGIKFCNYILSTFGSKQLLSSIIMTSLFIVAIYGGYFLVTYLCSKNIINGNK